MALLGSRLVYQTILVRSDFGRFLSKSRTNQNKRPNLNDALQARTVCNINVFFCIFVFRFVVVSDIFGFSSTQKMVARNVNKCGWETNDFSFVLLFRIINCRPLRLVAVFVTGGAKAVKMHFMFENAKQLVVNWKRNWSQRLWQAVEVRDVGIYVGCEKK